jgi:peptidoglycan/LPS O-acetylase OafA/YrhL
MEKNITLNSSHHRFRQLDSLRGIAALAVYFSHYIGILPHRLTPHFISVTPVGMLFNGYAAVMFFFVLSGFVELNIHSVI